MPLPVVNNTISLVSAAALGEASNSHSAVTGDNANYIARWGNAAWVGPQLKLSAEGLRNYWFIPDVPDEVSVAVVHANGYGEAYVLSRNYGGCEYHELYNATTKQLAFLHVFKGSGGLATYTVGAGWALRNKIYSNGLAAKFGKSSVWSVSCIDRSTTPPTVSSQFMGLLGTVAPPSATPGLVTGTVTSNPVVTVTHVDSGTNPP